MTHADLAREGGPGRNALGFPDVAIHRFVTADTIEEKIVERHHAKHDLANSLLEDTAHTLTANELIDLLRNR